MKFKFIDPNGPDYEQERMLRWEALNKPLGLPPGSELMEHDESSLHFIAIEKKQVIGCVCYYADNPVEGEIFHMAVSEEYRGRGFGRKLMHAMEHALSQKGVQQLYVYARQDAEGFYEKMGYRPDGKSMCRNGLPCRLMRKQLNAENL